MLTDIFVPLLTYPDADGVGRIDFAMEAVRHYAATISFTIFEVDIPNIVHSIGAEFVGVSGMIAAAESRSRARGEELANHIAGLNSAIPVASSRTKLREDQFRYAATSLASLHDLSVIEVVAGSIGPRQLAETLIFGSGRPVLVLPGTRGPETTGENIAIAWDGGRAASRAVHDAMPLIIKARSVTLLTAFDDKAIGENAVAGLAGYLSRHGVKSKHHDVTSAGTPIGVALQAGAIAQGAGLLVMGAFGHTRIRDFVMGGATRSVLDGVGLPLFLSH